MPPPVWPPATRAGVAPDSKHRVAAAAARLVQPGSTLLLDGGSTAIAVADALPPELAVNVITHSPTIAAAPVDHPTAEVYLLGGRLFKHSDVTCGAAVAEAAQAMQAHGFLPIWQSRRTGHARGSPAPPPAQ